MILQKQDEELGSGVLACLFSEQTMTLEQFKAALPKKWCYKAEILVAFEDLEAKYFNIRKPKDPIDIMTRNFRAHLVLLTPSASKQVMLFVSEF